MVLAAFTLIALLTLALLASIALIVRELATEQAERAAAPGEAKLPVAA